MTRDDVIATLKAHEAELRRLGVLRAALFGSLARGEERTGSDIDILVELDPEAKVGLWGYAGIVAFVKSLYEKPVDVAQRAGLRSHVRPSAERDAIYAF